VDSFHDSIQMMLKHPKDLVVQLGIGILQVLSLMSILWVIFAGLHQDGATFPQVLAMDVMQYLTASNIPTPGAAGAQEFTFVMFFGGKMFSE